MKSILNSHKFKTLIHLMAFALSLLAGGCAIVE